MVERFFLRRSSATMSESDPIMLLSGPHSCGKTSLLFQFAFNCASESTGNGKVMFLCNRRRLETKPPFLSQGIDPSSHVFKRIHMKTCQERYANPRGRDLAMVRTLALCHNAITKANEKGPCKLLLSDAHHGNTPRLLFIYKRWISSIFTIKGDGFGSFLLKNIDHSGSGSVGWMRTAKHSIALQYLMLEEVTEDGE
ncbi:uncharacterized protein LOC123230373 isoform X2 [Mangifera indica]|uniref:uncharacterized protein LOC123230373 isoform X2 n=1 Tax=Mangifera indica TaxID=29780 RepID=UPI001CF9FF42|nr:uncharacterized protein LOC123230373 isoform X2 [Mangifera indica]